MKFVACFPAGTQNNVDFNSRLQNVMPDVPHCRHFIQLHRTLTCLTPCGLRRRSKSLFK